MTEEDPEKTDHIHQKLVRPSCFWLRNFLSVTIENFGNLHRLYGAQPYTVGLLQANKVTRLSPHCLNKSVTMFFQTKMITPSLWNTYNFVLQIHFKIAHNFLSRLDIHPKDKVPLQIREDIQTTPILVNIQSSDIHKKTNSTYEKMTPKLGRTFGNKNKEPERTYMPPQKNKQYHRTTPPIQTLKRRIYHRYVATYRTKIANKHANSTMTTTFDAT